MSETAAADIHVCSKCETRNTEAEAAANLYRCIGCGQDLAHVDTAPNGAVRGIFGWLKQENDLIGDRYRVKTVLGKGGFGATYLVEDQRVNGKRRALKEIPELLFDEYEVSLLSSLEHPAIPDIADRFTEAGMVYLVLKFGGNRTLQSECRRMNGIPYATLKPWALELGNVLSYLHSRTPPIIHRDLKPENVLLDEGDRVMLIDFGIAKASDSGMTRTLGRAASHGFSPPEQVLGTGTDQRSDIYAYAATLYFALTGKTPAAAHERVAGKPLVPIAELVQGVPAAVDAALSRALSLNINERQANIEELLAVLEEKPHAAVEAMVGDRTVRVGDIAFGPAMGRTGPLSQPLHSVPLGHGTPPPVSAPVAVAPARWPLLAGGAAVLALIIGGAAYLMRDKGAEPAPTAATAGPAPAAQPPAVATTGVAVPAPATAVAPAIPAPSPAPAAPAGGSEADLLNLLHKTRSESEPDKTIDQPPKRTESIVSGGGTRASSASSRSVEPRPAPPKHDSDEGGWSITPGQTQKIR